MSVVAIPHIQDEREKFEKAVPDAILTSMEHFDPIVFGLPPM
jgi:hypothetical protein